MNINETIYKIESEKDVKKLRFKNLFLWLEIRNRFFFKLSIGKESNLIINSDTIKTVLLSFFYGFFNWFKKYDAWFLGSNLNRIELNGKYYDKLFDYPASKIKRSLFIELSTVKHYKRKKVYSKHIVSRAPLIILEKFIGIFINVSKIDTSVFKDIDKEYQTNVNPNYAIKKMISQYRSMKFLLFFKKPKWVFISPAYTHYGYIQALKEKNITIIEAQHGVINKEHFGYNVFTKLDKNIGPDYLLTFGERESEVFELPNIYINKKNVIPVGSFYIDYINQQLTKSIHKTSNKLIVSVSLQDCEIGEKVVPFIIEAAKQNPDTEFILKPRRTKIDFYTSKYSIPNNIKFIDNQDVYQVIKNSDIHVTAYSSCALEAPALGKMNVLLNFENKAKSYYESILNPENTFYVSTLNEFSTLLQTINIKSENEVKATHSKIMVANYQQNMDNFLKLLQE